MSPVSVASTIVADGPASGLPPMTGYRSDDFDARLAAVLSPGTATGGPGELLAWLGSIARVTTVEPVADADVLVTLAGSQPMSAKRLIHAVRSLAGATIDTAQMPLWAALVEGSAGIHLGIAGLLAAASPNLKRQSSSDPLPVQSVNSVAERSEPDHARLARELREMTRLPTAVLAAAMGVTREQYSRWVSGRPISAMRHGQLQYLHTIVRELVRRLGTERAVVWLHTPLGQDATPATLLQRRRLDLVHRAVAALPDAEPIRDGKPIALAAPMEDLEGIDADADADDGDDEAWTPYPTGSRNAEDGGSSAGR